MSPPTSPSSPGSEDSILPLSEPGSGASDRSNGTSPAPESSSDGGPMFPGGEMLLPTPNAQNFNDGQTAENWKARKAREREKGYNGNGGGTPIAMAIQLLAEGIYDANVGDLESARPRNATDQAPISSAEDSPASPSAPLDDARLRTTTAGSGRSSPVSFASLDPDGSWLRTSPDSSVQASLLGPLLVRFSGTWPRSGSMHGGIVSAHPMLERPTVGSGSSSLPSPRANKWGPPDSHGKVPEMFVRLHTPTATDGSPRYDRRASPGYMRAIPVPNLDAQIAELLPTPQTPHGGKESAAKKKIRGSGGGDLPGTIETLLPTPDAYEGSRGSGGDPTVRKASGHSLNLADVIEKGSLGDPMNPQSEDGNE